MVGLTRRTFFGACALGAFAASTPVLAAGASPVPLRAARVPAPVGVLTRLPGDGNQLALTVDDGASTAVVAAFAQFCADTGIRLTFFVNGANTSWTVNAPALRPMVDSGQVQLGNHTWSHPYINRLSLAAVADQIQRNADFLRNTYGVDGTPVLPAALRRAQRRHRPHGRRSRLPHHHAVERDVGDSLPENEASLIANARDRSRPNRS